MLPKRYKNTVGMAVQYKVISPNLFLLQLSTFHTRIKNIEQYMKLKGSAKSSAGGCSSFPGCKVYFVNRQL